MTNENAPFFIDREVIVLTKNGVWLADGTEITHDPTRRLFAKSLKKDKAGYFLHIGRETKRIDVEDTAYFVYRVDFIEGDPDRGVELWINDETKERLDPFTLQYRPGRLVCKIKNGKEEAKFLHAAYFDLLKDLKEDRTHYYLLFGKRRVNLASRN